MRILSLLLLFSSLTAPLGATETVQRAAPTAQLPAAEDFAAELAATKQDAQFAWNGESNFAGDADGICYKIRVYLFTRDDDHAPELAGSTTCGPRQPRAKNVVWPGARLVPAN